MRWDELAVVGRIARTHGNKGQVILDSESDFPDRRFRPGAELFVDRGGRVEPLTLTAVRFQRGRPIVGIEGVETVSDAERLAGLELRVPRAWLEPLPPGTYFRHDLVGCRVETRSGQPVGVVRRVDGLPGGDQLVVEGDGGREVMVPLVGAICVAVDLHTRRIVVDPPEGLLDLNR
jgi:16S rRNA processing protein RimM